MNSPRARATPVFREPARPGDRLFATTRTLRLAVPRSASSGCGGSWSCTTMHSIAPGYVWPMTEQSACRTSSGRPRVGTITETRGHCPGSLLSAGFPGVSPIDARRPGPSFRPRPELSRRGGRCLAVRFTLLSDDLDNDTGHSNLRIAWVGRRATVLPSYG